MKRLKLLGLATLALLALTAITATNATAANGPNLLPGKETTFTFKSKAAENTVLETLATKKVVCKKATGSGEATSDTLGTAKFKFEECKESTLSTNCQSGSTTGVIEFSAEWHLRYLLPSTGSGSQIVVLLPTAGITFTCASGTLKVEVKGCVASMDLEKGGNGGARLELLQKVLVIGVNFLQTAGDAEITSIDTQDGEHMENCVLLSNIGGAGFESSGQLGAGTIEGFKEKGTVTTEVELMA